MWTRGGVCKVLCVRWRGAWARAGWRVWDLGNGTIMLQKSFNPELHITSKSFLLSSFLIGFSFSPPAEISRLELEFKESLPRKTASIFKKGIGQESNGAANQEKQIFLLCQISPSASSTRDLGTRLRKYSLTLDNFSFGSQQLVPNYCLYPSKGSDVHGPILTK